MCYTSFFIVTPGPEKTQMHRAVDYHIVLFMQVISINAPFMFRLPFLCWRNTIFFLYGFLRIESLSDSHTEGVNRITEQAYSYIHLRFI